MVDILHMTHLHYNFVDLQLTIFLRLQFERALNIRHHKAYKAASPSRLL